MNLQNNGFLSSFLLLLKVLHLFFQLLLTFTLLLNKHISCPNRLFLIGHVTLTDLLSPPLTPSCYSTGEIISFEENGHFIYSFSPHHPQPENKGSSKPPNIWKMEKKMKLRGSLLGFLTFLGGPNEICFLLFYFLTFLLPPIDFF